MNSSEPPAKQGYSGKIPVAAYSAFKRELTGVVHGTISLTFHLRDAKLARYETDRRTSFLPEELAEGDHEVSR
jgi:hypothetical protein